MAWMMMPVVAADAPVPIWEIHARLDGNTSPVFGKWIAELLGQRATSNMLSGHTVLRVAGFAEPSTPANDWICEISGLRGVESLMDDIKAKDGKAVMRQGEIDFVVSIDGGSTLKIVSPAAMADRSFPEMRPMADEAWLSGSIDLTKVEHDKIKSQLLRMPKQLAFTAVGTAGTVTLEMRGVLANADAAKSARRLLKEIGVLLEKSNRQSDILPSSLSCDGEGPDVVLRLTFNEEALYRHLGWIRDTIMVRVAGNQSVLPSSSKK